jgi:hypothetical protein
MPRINFSFLDSKPYDIMILRYLKRTSYKLLPIAYCLLPFFLSLHVTTANLRKSENLGKY